MEKACEECTQNCVMMHQTYKNPSSLVTTFFKVMMGDDYSKYLFLPPQFARTVKKLVDKRTRLEGFSGQKWDVKITKIHGKLVFEEGWNKFALDHGLQKGDFLVFYYIKKSHFVVLIYGPTGCPENRHFGLHNQSLKETKKNDNNLPVNNQSPAEVHTNCNDFSHESSSKSEPLVHGVNNTKTINKKLNEVNMSANENTTNTQHLVASSSQPLDKETDQVSESLDKNTNKKTDQRPEPLVKNTDKETDQRSEPLVKNTDKETDQRSEPFVKNTDKETDQRSEPLVESTTLDDMASKSPTTVKPSGLVDNGNGYEADEGKRNILQQVVEESDSGQKNNAVTSGGGLDKTKINRIPERLETRLKMSDERRKESTMRQSEDTHSSSVLKRSRPASVPNTQSKIVKTEPGTSASRLHNSGNFPKPVAKPMELIKTEPAMNHGSGGPPKNMKHGLDGLIKREPKPVAKPMEPIKTEPAMNHGSGGPPKNMKHGLDGLIKREPKPEPIDYDDAPLSDPSLASFSATMSSYQYLELPGSVKLKSGVILLRNGTDLWAVLFQTKFGLKVLTQNWGTFAKEKGIKPGDTCVFVLESTPKSRSTCNVFDVYVTRK